MTKLERDLERLEKDVKGLRFATDGTVLEVTPFAPKNVENESTKTHEQQFNELHTMWHNCQIVGDGVTVQGSMKDGWAVSGAPNG